MSIINSNSDAVVNIFKRIVPNKKIIRNKDILWMNNKIKLAYKNK